MPIQRTLKKGKVPVRIWTGDIQSAARDQLANVSQMPFVHHPVATMPDVHAGIGATVGSVIPTKDTIVPAAAVMGIGCGINAIRGIPCQINTNTDHQFHGPPRLNVFSLTHCCPPAIARHGGRPSHSLSVAGKEDGSCFQY